MNEAYGKAGKLLYDIHVCLRSLDPQYIFLRVSKNLTLRSRDRLDMVCDIGQINIYIYL